jgi:hypothetical protein
MGKHLKLDRDVEILVVGGAAGVLTGELPGSWTTGDVDVLHCRLPQDRDDVLDAAAAVTDALGLPRGGWMNDFGGLHAWTLPHDWETRRVLIDRYAHLHVYAVGRLDLMAMKFLAGRTRDLEHLHQLAVTSDEKCVVKSMLTRSRVDHPEHADRIDLAMMILEEWETAGGDEEGSVER